MGGDFSKKCHVGFDLRPWEISLVANAHRRIEARGHNHIDRFGVDFDRSDCGGRRFDDALRRGHFRVGVVVGIEGVGKGY